MSIQCAIHVADQMVTIQAGIPGHRVVIHLTIIIHDVFNTGDLVER